MSTSPKTLGVAVGTIASASQAVVASASTTSATTTELQTDMNAVIVLVNQLRKDLISAGIITGAA